jgi:hypothetical protein
MINGKRVLQISLDVLIDESIDGEDLARTIRTELEEHGLGLTILGAGFQCDLTEEYKKFGGYNEVYVQEIEFKHERR